MAKAVKLADIAKQLNVSTVTVSKALSNQKGVSEELREKIKELADELGYRSPSAARQMNMPQSYNIGVLISERYLDKYESFYWQMYQALLTRAARKQCFIMLEVLSQEHERALELPVLLKEDKVDGMIVIGLLEERYLDVLETTTTALLYMDFYNRKKQCDAVITDNYYGMYEMTNYLFDMGHTQIAYVGKLLYTSSITDRFFGYAKALVEHGERVREDWIIDDRDEVSGKIDEGDTIRLPSEMPTAFVCNCDLAASALIARLRERGYQVPEDISVIGFDNYLYPGLCNIGITTYEVDIKEMARKSINIVIKKISGVPYKKGVTIIQGSPVMKESVAAFPIES